MAHRFRIGSRVSLQFTDARPFPTSTFIVEAHMPPVGTTLQYRIKSEAEGFRRMVSEHQLSALGVSHEPTAAVARGHHGEEN